MSCSVCLSECPKAICQVCDSRKKQDDHARKRLVGTGNRISMFAAQMRLNPTPPELALDLALRKAQIPFRFQVEMYGFIADFYIRNSRLVVEVDGEYHDNPEQRLYDLGRTRRLNNHKFRVLRIQNEEALKCPLACVDKIRQAIASPSPIKHFPKPPKLVGKRLEVILQSGASAQEIITALAAK